MGREGAGQDARHVHGRGQCVREDSCGGACCGLRRDSLRRFRCRLRCQGCFSLGTTCGLLNPPQSLGGLVALIAIFLIVSGLVRLARVLVTQSRGRAWTVMTGVVALLLGISVWIGWPFGKLWFVGICIAIDFICHGVSWSAL